MKGGVGNGPAFFLYGAKIYRFYSYYQNNIPFQPPDNFVSVGKNSQTKAHKREQGHGFLECCVVV
jgi:transglutaminase-like putative cysteine protease